GGFNVVPFSWYAFLSLDAGFLTARDVAYFSKLSSTSSRFGASCGSIIYVPSASTGSPFSSKYSYANVFKNSAAPPPSVSEWNTSTEMRFLKYSTRIKNALFSFLSIGAHG